MTDRPDSVAVILGSAFEVGASREGASLEIIRRVVETSWGSTEIHSVQGLHRPAHVLFRHGRPHRRLPHQIPYRAQAEALAQLGCGALLVTSSVGVLDPRVPLFHPMLLEDLLMPDNRLPDGTPCTMFLEPSAEQGHLVLSEGLFSKELNGQLSSIAVSVGLPSPTGAVFAYAPGPRTKTAAENRMWARLGAQVNSMTLAPEVVLANELGIPCAGLVVGHKYSVPYAGTEENPDSLTRTLQKARAAVEAIVVEFIRNGRPVPFRNHLYRFRREGD